MAWLTAQQLIDSWIGDNAPSDEELVNTWIARGERMIRRRIPDLEERLETAPAIEDGVATEQSLPDSELFRLAQDILATVVTRVLRNPEGIRQANVTTGPYTESRTYSGDLPGVLDLTEQELADLTGKTTGQRAFTIDMTPQRTAPLTEQRWL